MISASELLCRLNAWDSATAECLVQVYGPNPALLESKRALLGKILLRFLEAFGDRPVQVFRAPGRINLRGMHVDTHGGYLNLMTHQRDVVAVCHPGGTMLKMVHVDPAFAPVGILANEILDPNRNENFESWERYAMGVLYALRGATRRLPEAGMLAAIGGDLPLGAGLSSSAALCLVLLQCLLSANDTVLNDDEMILAARAAEWHAGARTGVSDQAAILLGRQNSILDGALLAEDLHNGRLRYQPFPEELSVVVADSGGRRALSGEARADYVQNRFAYSFALEIFRQILHARGVGESLSMDRLSRVIPESLGGASAIYEFLHDVPDRMDLVSLQARVQPDLFYNACLTYFGISGKDSCPASVPLRGPLLYAIAESERARCFPELLARRNFDEAGKLMFLGHDGDRVIHADGRPFSRTVSIPQLREWARTGQPIARCPGDYGASTPALDALVDAALQGGALGASLTGAGLGGCIVALCHVEHAQAIAESLRSCIMSKRFAGLAGANVQHAEVLVNTTVAGAGEIAFS